MEQELAPPFWKLTFICPFRRSLAESVMNAVRDTQSMAKLRHSTGLRLEVSGGTLHSVVGLHKLMGILHMEKERQLHNQGNWSLQSPKMSRSNTGQGEQMPRLQ